MPSFGGHIPTQQIWQLVAYVQSMSGQVPATAAPGRNDDQMAALPESRQSHAGARADRAPVMPPIQSILHPAGHAGRARRATCGG